MKRSVVIGLVLVGGSMAVGAGPAAAVPPANTTSLALSALPSTTVPVGTTVTPQAVLSGGGNGANKPTGDLAFNAYSGATCSGTAFIIAHVAVNGNGTYSPTLGGVNATAAGQTFSFRAVYAGNASNSGSTSACVAVTVVKATPSVTTSALPSTLPVGGSLTDTATVSGGFFPTGNVTFRLYGPNDTTCTGPVVGFSTNGLDGSGHTTSSPVTVNVAGTYRWVATYNGDSNNNVVSTPCGDPSETVTVTKAAPSLSTTAFQNGAGLYDDARLLGASAPTGTLTFTLYGPTDATCTAAPVFTQTVPVQSGATGPNGGPATNGEGGPYYFDPTVSGTYRWVVTYSGDTNNRPATSACNAPNESITITGSSGPPGP